MKKFPPLTQPVFSLYANGKLIEQGYNLKSILERIEKITTYCIVNDTWYIPLFDIKNTIEKRQLREQEIFDYTY